MTPKERKLMEDMKSNILRLMKLNDDLDAENEAARREASRLAENIWRVEFQELAPDWELSDSTAGIISQIDNMYSGVREQRDTAWANIRELQRWKDEALSVWPPLQEIGRELGMPLGVDIGSNIIPYIRKLKEELADGRC